mmetsp:Transcript_921/g.1041  ORF Transcript_921/g.1041 Transcript_921/m.1041 type:complete len:131 (+) Transcript_921:2834-3226(+)
MQLINNVCPGLGGTTTLSKLETVGHLARLIAQIPCPSLVQHSYQQLTPQMSCILINANTSRESALPCVNGTEIALPKTRSTLQPTTNTPNELDTDQWNPNTSRESGLLCVNGTREFMPTPMGLKLLQAGN